MLPASLTPPMTPTLDVRRITPLRGPNGWSCTPVLEVLLAIGDLEDWPSHRIPGFADRLLDWMPALADHRDEDGPDSFAERLARGVSAAHAVEHVALALQRLAGMRGGFGCTRATRERGAYLIAVSCWQEDVTTAAVSAARDLVLAAMESGRTFAVADVVTALREQADDLCLGPSTDAIVRAAEERRIPAIRLTDGNLVQLGHGSRQRRIWTAETDRTSAIAEGISRDKSLTKQLIACCGVPIPEGRRVTSPEEAWEAAQAVGVPVVVKPVDGNHGRGVVLGLTTEDEVRAAYPIALAEGSGVLVERFVPGDEHRLLVVGGRLVAAARGEAAYVIGDGRHTIEALIESQLNSDPRRGGTEDHPLNPVRIDSAVRVELRHQGFTPESVPPADTRVLIQRNGNMSLDVTDEVHPAVAARAVLAAKIVGLDIAGIDLVAEDIRQPLEAQRGAIVEVNAGPGLMFHLKPTTGPGQPVGQAIVDHLFEAGDDGRIPVVGVTGTHGTTRVARLVAHLLHLHGLRTGLVCDDGVFVDRRRLHRAGGTTWQRGQDLLLNRGLDAVVIENGLHAILTEGLPYDRCRIGVVTGLDLAVPVSVPGLPDGDADLRAAGAQVNAARAGGTTILNADEARAADLARLSDGEVILFGRRDDSPALADHLARGGRAVFLRGDRVIASVDGQDALLADFASCSASARPHTLHDEHAALAAVAAAWALDLPADLLRTGLATFAWQGTLESVR